MIIKELLAKKKNNFEQSLYDHSLLIANLSYKLITNICDDEKICWLTYISALLHDIGKSSKQFQEHLKTNYEMDLNDFYPLHNILGACLISNFIRCEIESDNLYLETVIAKSILYHHPVPNTDLSKQIDTIENIIYDDYFKAIINEFIELNNTKFPNHKLYLNNKEEIYIQNTIDNLTYYISNIDYSVTKQDIFNIVSNVIRFADSLFKNNSTEDELTNRKYQILETEIIKPYGYDSRFEKQIEYAKILNKYNDSVFESQTGFGKTMLGILYSLFANNRKTYWVCPRNTIAEGVYHTIINEIKNLNLSDKLSVGLLLTNEFVYGDKTCDIIVTNIDNFLRPVISNDCISFQLLVILIYKVITTRVLCLKIYFFQTLFVLNKINILIHKTIHKYLYICFSNYNTNNIMFLKKLYNNIIDKIINIYFKKEIKNNKLIQIFIRFLKENHIFYDCYLFNIFYKKMYLYNYHLIINFEYDYFYFYSSNKEYYNGYHLFTIYTFYISKYHNIEINCEKYQTKWERIYKALIYKSYSKCKVHNYQSYDFANFGHYILNNDIDFKFFIKKNIKIGNNLMLGKLLKIFEK